MSAESNPRNQRDRLTRIERTIGLLPQHKHERVPLPEVQRVAGAQHGARLKEARALGYVIDNELERTSTGEIRSFYILRAEPGETPSLFGDISADRTYRA